MQELMIDFIVSLDGHGESEGWPGFWGLQGPEYLAWLEQQPPTDYVTLMGAKTYRLMSGMAVKAQAGELAVGPDEEASLATLAQSRWSCSRRPSTSRWCGPRPGWRGATPSRRSRS